MCLTSDIATQVFQLQFRLCFEHFRTRHAYVLFIHKTRRQDCELNGRKHSLNLIRSNLPRKCDSHLLLLLLFRNTLSALAFVLEISEVSLVAGTAFTRI
jgi:hypothetical protein